VNPEDLKACCVAAYQRDAVALILGDSYHPGGLALTRRLADALMLRAGELVADIASGPGTTALLLAGEHGVAVDGVDLSEVAVSTANARAERAQLGARVVFHVGDSERLPLADASVDAVVCECAWCTFPDKAAAASEMARILRPGGRVGITDVTLDRGRLGPELVSLAGWVACIAGACPIGEYRRLLEGAGLDVTLVEQHDDALARMVETIDARVAAYQMTGAPALAGLDIGAVRQKVAIARRAVADGTAAYALLVAHKPTR
jgi:SAM-dependent methyltransferase